MRAFRSAVAALFLLVLASCGSSKSAVMPDVAGKKLDVARSDIQRAGFDDEVEVVGGGMLGVVVESNWQVCDQSPAAGKPVKGTPRLTVDRSCDAGGSSEAAAAPTTTTEPEVTTTSAPAYTYSGPKYEVVTIDQKAGMGQLDQYWVFTEKLDYSSDAYKDQLKLLISDVAHSAGTNKLLVEVVTDKEIAQAEAASTSADFIAERGTDYAVNVIPQNEKTEWVASYAGGIDYNAGELSDSDTAFEIIWFGYSDNPVTEKWKPAVAN